MHMYAYVYVYQTEVLTMSSPIHPGVLRFQQDVFPAHKSAFQALKHGQDPKVLFVTCSDSRLVPSLLTGTSPGDLFVMRNAGNIVPPYGAGDLSSAATIEYAMDALQVEHVVVCGHSHCGAMKAALNPASTDAMPAVREWLKHAEATRRVVTAMDVPEQEREILAVERNVIQQLRNLQTHPSVAARMATGNVVFHGWAYHFENGSVYEHDPVQDRFLPLGELHAGAPAEREDTEESLSA